MTKIELYETAREVGKKLTAETDPIKLSLALGHAATEKKVAPEDFVQFMQFVNEAKHTYHVLGQQKLPSEIKAANDAKAAAVKKPAPTT